MPVYKYKKEIVAEYGCARKTLYNKLRNNNLIIDRGLLSPAQQKLIYECLGYPEGVDRKDYENVKLPQGE